MKQFSLRLLAVTLAITMLAANFVTTVTALGSVGALEQDQSSTRETITVTDAKIIANHYDFVSEGEKAVLNCNAIIGNTHTIPIPSDDDDLITIDSENQTVSAKQFKKGDYTWLPVKAYLVYQDAINSEIKNAITLDENGNGSFSTSVESYSIEVEYEVKVAIDVDLQLEIANAPALLIGGLTNLENAAACENNLATVASEEVFSVLNKMTSPLVHPAVPSFKLTIFDKDSAAYDAIKYMEADRNANGGTFGLCNAIKAYKQSQINVKYLINNGSDFKETCKIADSIIALSDGFGAAVKLMKSAKDADMLSEQDYESMLLLQEILATLSSDLSKIKEENWAVLDNIPVKADATDNELTALDLALNAAKGRVSMHDGETFVEAPVAAQTTVSAGVAQSYVNVTVKAQVVDATNKLSTLDGKTARFLMKNGASEQEIKDKVEAMGVRQESLAYWTQSAAIYNIDSDYYVCNTTVSHNAVTGETDVEITYAPKTYTISSDYAVDAIVPYGYKLCLENHSDPSKSYDYKVNGVAKYQGDMITVCENLYVNRVEGVALKGSTVNAVVADSLVGATLSAEARNILKVNGFKANEYKNYFGAIRYRVPTVASLETTAQVNGYKITAPSVSSGTLSGSKWIAASVDLLDENGNLVASYAITNGSAEFVCDEAFANARVNFELVVEDINGGDALTVANLPFTLTNEASAQLAILNRMADGSLYDALSSLSEENINLIVTVVNASKMSQGAKDSIALLKTDCMDMAGNILLYSYLTSYKIAKQKSAAEGLKYYYTANNAANIKNQLDILSGVFNALCPDDETNADRIIFTNLLTSNGLGSYVEKLDSIREAIDECKDILPANEFIDGNSASLGALTAAICNAIGKTAEYDEETAVVLISSIDCASPDRSAVSVVINVVKGDGTVDSRKETITLPKGTEIGDIIVDKFNALDAQLTINKNYYTVTGADSIPAGNIVIDDITKDIVVTYAPYSYTVSIPGAADQSFYYDADWSITLPASPNNSTKLVYTVDGETVEVINESARYTFDSLDAFDSNRHLDVTVESVDLETERFITFINILNEAFGEVGARFIPVKDAQGNVIIVLRTSSDLSSAIDSGVLTNLPAALAMYDNVQLGGNLFWDGKAIHLQAMTDMVASSQFSLDTLCNIIRENGTVINDEDLGALEPMIDPDGNIGGRLMTSSINLDGRELGFYVTLSDTTSASMLSKMRSAVMKVKDYVNIICADGQFQFVINAPDSIYPYYLAQMLVSGNVDITDISALNLRDSIKYEWGLIQNVLCDDRLSVETLENTFAALGKDVDLSKLDALYNNFKKANNYLESNVEVDIHGSASDKYSGTFKIDLNGVFNKVAEKFGLNDTVMGLIYEADPDAESFEINFSVKLANIVEKDYDAIVFDINGNGLTKKFFCSGNLTEVLNDLGNYGIVILTSDATLTQDVYVPQNAIIDLNGFTLTGNISSGGTVRIVDSRLGVEEAGTLNGKLGAGNFIITGGKYTSNISKHLTNGYYVNENGYVRNEIYSVSKNGNDMELALSAAYINKASLVDFQAILVDVAVDIAMSTYNGAAITIDGKNVYSFSAKDITSILGGGTTSVVNSIIDILDTEGLSYVINSVANSITDFDALSNAINNNEPLAEYQVCVKSWDIVSYIADGNYITFDSVPSETNKKQGKLTIVIEGSPEEKAELAEFCNDLGVIEVNEFNVDLKDISYQNGFTVDLNGEIDVHVNFAKNRAYAALICAAAAYGTNDQAKKTAYVEALENYLSGEGSNAIMLVLESMTTAEIISALKAINSVSCEKMFTDIGISQNQNTDEVARLLGSYDNVVRIANVIISKLGVEGNGATLKGHKVANTYATYRFATELVNRIKVSLTLTTVSTSGDMDFGDVSISGSVAQDKVSTFKTFAVNGTSGIAIDMHRDGMTVYEFIKMLNINIEGAINTTFAVYSATGALKAENERIGTGDVLIITAFNGVDYDSIEQVIVVVGDTDGDGQTGLDDAANIAEYKMGTAEMTEAQKIAADINGNGRIDVGDAAKIAYKAVATWEEYKEG